MREGRGAHISPGKAGNLDPGTTTGLCHLCRAATTHADGIAYAFCTACDRQRHRVGLTKCCGVLPVAAGGKYYCPACPGRGKAGPVILTSPDGRFELPSWHPPLARVGRAESLADLAKSRGVEIGGLVLKVGDLRAWHMRSLRGVADASVKRFRCRQCKRHAVRKRVGAPVRLCLDCVKANQRTSVRKAQRAYRARKSPRVCASCGNMRLIESGGMCCACRRRVRLNGLHACGVAMAKTRQGEMVCPACSPTQDQRKKPIVPIVVTDGEAFLSCGVSEGVDIGGRRAGAWIAPLVLVETIRPRHQWIKGRPVISGIAVPNTGTSTRALLPLLKSAASLEESRRILQRELDSSTATSTLGRLRLAGLVGDSGLTPKAHEVLAWCAAAGVKL